MLDIEQIYISDADKRISVIRADHVQNHNIPQICNNRFLENCDKAQFYNDIRDGNRLRSI